MPIDERFNVYGNDKVVIVRDALDREADRLMGKLGDHYAPHAVSARGDVYAAAKALVTAHEMWLETEAEPDAE